MSPLGNRQYGIELIYWKRIWYIHICSENADHTEIYVMHECFVSANFIMSYN